MGIASTLVSVISKKTIKPFSPTPCTKIFHKLCLPGQAFTLNHVPLVLFYPKKPNIGPKKLCKFLEVSLSKTLAYYYPYAGRLINNWTVECNDNGAEFFEVRVNSGMDEVLHHSTDSRIKDIVTFPQGVPWSLDFMDSSSHHHHHHHQALATAQLSHFDCGGIAISVCLSHKVGDAESVYRFLKDWAALTRRDDDSNNIVLSPYFVQDSILPSPPDQGPLVSPVSKKKQECVEKTFDFTPAKLNALKASVNKSEEILQYPPTRSEVVNALVYKCAANAASSSLSDRSSPPAHQLVQYMNIRESISPPLPPTSIGNMLTAFSTPIHREGDLTIAKVIANIRKSRDDYNNNNNTRNKDQHNEWVSEILHAYRTGKGTFQQRNCDVYISSSLCKYPFQEIDFGWGKPSRTRLGGHSISKYFALMNTNDGGIHVSIHLTEKDMAVFENDHHLLQFATPPTEMKPESTVYGF
ncbi:hypothetical protein P3S68_033844 [Capsicum galapagoense]